MDPPSSTVEKHPRIRGENLQCVFGPDRTSETSPHTRGELGVGLNLPTEAGNIPAYAGRTGEQKNPGDSTEKHPRIRGEN